VRTVYLEFGNRKEFSHSFGVIPVTEIDELSIEAKRRLTQKKLAFQWLLTSVFVGTFPNNHAKWIIH
jgi:hypothetical protein